MGDILGRILGPALAAAAMILCGARASAETITLQQAIDRALRVAPSIAVAAATSDLSAARVREQRAPLYPSVSAGTEYYQAPGYNQIVTNRGLSAGMLMMDYTAFDFGRRLARMHAAQYAREASMLGVSAARAQIVFDTKSVYFDLLRSRHAVNELQSNLLRLRRYVATVEALQQSGHAITNDVLKIQSARDTGEFALAAERSNAARASVALGSMFGEFDHADLQVAELGPLPAKPSGDIAQSPVLQAAQRAISAATLQVNAAMTERLPTFQTALTAGFLGIDPPQTVNHNGGASYDMVISMPVFDGGLTSSHIDQAKAREHSALAQARDAEYLLARRIADASLRYDHAREALDILARSQPTADDSFALTWTRFLGGGDTTVLEVVDAYQQAEQLRLQRIDQEFAARQAAAEVILICGGIE
ncbi:MAG TPA: TolC family protein [Candidatus Binataceae bacterium]